MTHPTKEHHSKPFARGTYAYDLIVGTRVAITDLHVLRDGRRIDVPGYHRGCYATLDEAHADARALVDALPALAAL